MIPDDVLRLAVGRGVITDLQAGELRALANAAAPPPLPDDRLARDPAPGVDEESLRFIGSFADIFVTIGIGLFLSALYTLVNLASAGQAPYAAVFAATWLLAEFFTRRRRMSLPSIVLLLIYLAAGFATVMSALGWSAAAAHRGPIWLAGDDAASTSVIIAAVAAMGLAVLHYRRFRVPITIAGGTAALWLALATIVLAIPGVPGWAFSAMLLAFGLATFSLAMRFDLADPARLTRRTDIAFWLHLLASPLIVHSLIGGFLGGRGALTAEGAGTILLVFVLLGAVAIVIDRRAMLVSGLFYAGTASGRLIETFGWNHSNVLMPTVLFILGAFIILVSAGWHPLRRSLLALLPAALAGRLPHPLAVSST